MQAGNETCKRLLCVCVQSLLQITYISHYTAHSCIAFTVVLKPSLIRPPGAERKLPRHVLTLSAIHVSRTSHRSRLAPSLVREGGPGRRSGLLYRSFNASHHLDALWSFSGVCVQFDSSELTHVPELVSASKQQ